MRLGKRVLPRLRGRVSGLLGLSFFGFDFMKLLKMHSLFSIGTNLSSVFVGVFFIHAGGSLAMVCLFYLFSFAFEAVGNSIAAGMAGKFPSTFITRMGLVFITLFYILLLVTPEFAARFFPVTAALTGIGNAMYWPPYQNYCVEYTHPGNRQKGVSLLGLTGNFIAFVSPLVSGLITSRLPGTNGYLVIFAVSVTALLSSFLLTRGMPSAPTGRAGNPLLTLLVKHFKDRAVRSVALMAATYGLRDGIYIFYMNILIYDMVKSEMAIGLNVAVRSIVAMLAWLALARFVPPERRQLAFAVTLAAGLGASVLFWAVPAAAVLMTIYIADMLFQVVSYNALQFAGYELADHLAGDGQNHRPEAIGLRIFSLNIGRCVGIAVFLLLPSVSGAVWPLILLNALALPGALFAGFRARPAG